MQHESHLLAGHNTSKSKRLGQGIIHSLWVPEPNNACSISPASKLRCEDKGMQLWERSTVTSCLVGKKRESQYLAAHPIAGFYKAFSHPETTHTFPTQIPTPRQRFQSCDPVRNMRQGWNTKSARTRRRA